MSSSGGALSNRGVAIERSPITREEPGARSKGWNWITARGAIVLAVVFLSAYALPFTRRGKGGDWRACYIDAATRMRAGEKIHAIDERSPYAYPPAMAMLAIPFALLPSDLGIWAWYLANGAALCVVFRYSWRLAGGDRLANLNERERRVFWLGTFLISRYVLAALENQQTDIVITALLLSGVVALERGRKFLGGVWIGLSAAMKCTPLLLVVYLAWRRRFVAAAVALIVACGINLAPDVLFPQSSGGSYLSDWNRLYLSRARDGAPGSWFSALILNQSLAGFVNRVAQVGFPLSLDEAPNADAVWSEGQIGSLRLASRGAILALILATVWRFRRGRSEARELDAREADQSEAFQRGLGLECAAILCLMLLASPMTSKAHFVALVLPCFLVARAHVPRVKVDRLAGASWPLIAGLSLFGPLTSKALTGKTLGDLTLCWGFPTLFALLLWLAVVRMAPRAPRFALQSRGDSPY